MDNEMIERVIKASFDCWNEHRGLTYSVSDLSSSDAEFAKAHAVAIIKAMREPTEKMKSAMMNVEGYADCDPAEYYQAAIDAVINE